MSNMHLNFFKGLPSSCSWSKSRVKRPGWCTLCHLKGSEMKGPTPSWILSKMLMASATYHTGDSLRCQHQTSFSQKVLKTEDLTMSLRFGIPLKSLLPSSLSTRDAFNWVVIYPCSARMSGTILLYAMLFSANLVLRHYTLNWDSERMLVKQTKQPFIVRQHWYHSWSAQGLNIKQPIFPSTLMHSDN